MSYYSTKPQPSSSVTAITVTNTNSSNSSSVEVLSGATTMVTQLNATISSATDIAIVAWQGYYQNSTTTPVSLNAALYVDGVLQLYSAGREMAADGTSRHNMGGSAILTGLTPGTVNFAIVGAATFAAANCFVKNFDVVVLSRSS